MARRIAISSRRVVFDGRLAPASIIVEDGLIDTIEDLGKLPPRIDHHDHGEAVIMPGMIDAHVHINEPGRTDWEGFETATRAAAAGGITTVVDMPLNSSPVTTTVDHLETKRQSARDISAVDVAFYAGLIPTNEDQIEGLVSAGVKGVKAFLCHSGLDAFPNVTRRELRAVMPLLADRDIPLLVHAEVVDDKAPTPDESTSYADYLASRPTRFEKNAIALLIDLCRQTGCPVHIVHLAASDALPMLKRARQEGLPITVETCPHYLYFCAEEIPDAAPRYKCAPPIRGRSHRQRLRRALSSGHIDMVATDHSPSPPALKSPDTGDLMSAWGGISSLQLLLPALWSATRHAGATPVDIARWTSKAPATMLRMDDELGEIRPGRRAHLTVWNPEATRRIDATDLYHRHPITPYHDQTLHGSVCATYLAGQRIYDGQHINGPPQGRLLA